MDITRIAHDVLLGIFIVGFVIEYVWIHLRCVQLQKAAQRQDDATHEGNETRGRCNTTARAFLTRVVPHQKSRDRNNH